MKLYGSYTSPFVRHCRIALLESGLDCEFIETDFIRSGKLSPTKRVPFLEDGELILSDSNSILKHIREKSGIHYLQDVKAFDLFCFANTLLDSAINVFFLEKDNITAEQSRYIKRQQARIVEGLELLDQQDLSTEMGDAEWRVACLLDWGLFRQRITLDGLENLQAFLAHAKTHSAFVETAPPATT